jgi:predicted ATP-grasp superfamily ATP-dependent carboligase
MKGIPNMSSLPQNKINVLIFPAGAENALEIYYSLRYNLHLDVFGASGKPDHAGFIYPPDHYIEGNFYITSPSFLDDFNLLLKKYKIDIVIPTHDTIALFMAENRPLIQAKIIVSDSQTARLCREKKLTYALMAGYDFCPQVYKRLQDIPSFPVFLKPNRGEGSKGTFIAQSMDEVVARTSVNPELLICEYLPGQELTVDCFTNKKQELLFVGPRTRERVQMGISFHSESVELTEEIQRIARIINSKLELRGAWFFQVKQDRDSQYKLLEISARQAGTMALYRQVGVNFALLSIFDLMDVDISILKNRLDIKMDRCLHNRYHFNYKYDDVYVDFDDTIIVEGKVNDFLMQYLYQATNCGKKLHLITRHELNISETLKAYKIAENLFDEIILLSPMEKKSDHIQPQKAIFIDNHFSERKLISERFGIPVFDVDAVECLVN